LTVNTITPRIAGKPGGIRPRNVRRSLICGALGA
jgi:hypothetical protein